MAATTFNRCFSQSNVKYQVKIQKMKQEQQLAFGWAYTARDKEGGVVVDSQEDTILPEELERAAYQFVRLYREGGEMHQRGGAATLIESVMFTEEKNAAMGLPPGAVPIGWWVGFQVTDPAVWAKVKEGKYTMFSIEGTATRMPQSRQTHEAFVVGNVSN